VYIYVRHVKNQYISLFGIIDFVSVLVAPVSIEYIESNCIGCAGFDRIFTANVSSAIGSAGL